MKLLCDILSPEAYMAERRLMSIDSELEVMIMSMAEMKERADTLMTDKKLRSQLSEDELINAGSLSEKMGRFMTELTELKKQF